MDRRHFLAAAGGLGAVGTSAWVLRGGLGSGDDLPVTVDTVEARGSSAGTVRLPVEGRVTVVDLFATWCPPCEKQMASLAAVHDERGDDVAFVSVTNERLGGSLTEADLREWWADHDGAWTLGVDPESTAMSAFGAQGLPTLAVVDAAGTVGWTHEGVAAESVLRTAIDDAEG